MNVVDQLYNSMIAVGDEETIEPTALLEAFDPEQNGFAQLHDNESGRKLFEAFAAEFGFIRHARMTSQPASPENVLRWVQLVGWLIRSLVAWRVKDDPQLHILAATAVISASSGLGLAFWRALPVSLGENKELITALVVLVHGTRSEFSTVGSRPAPLWEQVTVAELQRAEHKQDWATIGRLWPTFEHSIMPSVSIQQPIQWLYRYDVLKLAEATSEFEQIATAIQAVNALPSNDALRLGELSRNSFVQFACCVRALARGPESEPLSNEGYASLVVILGLVGAERVRWESWMEVFNRYPVRYPKLQAPLGTFLATASQECLHTYIYSINLTILEAKPDQNRTTIAICFEQFWRVADKEQRTILWRLAFQRWTEWDFDQNDDNTQLVWICWSPLDYAIVAYAREVLDETERQALLLRWTNELSMLDTRWFASHTDMISSWNRLLSCFQPVAHALTVEDTAEGWLNERATFLPFDGVVKDFVSLMYRMR